MNELNLDQWAINLAVEMTARTGELWRTIPETENRRPQIVSDDACLLLSEDWRTHRLRIAADAPREMREKTQGEQITCDAQRHPEAIARDVCTRLLQSARAHMTESKVYDHEKKKESNKKNLRKKMIMKYLPREYQDEKFCTISGSRHGYVERIYAHPTYDELVNIEINLPLKKALQLLKQLTKEIE